MIIDGKAIANKIQNELKLEIDAIQKGKPCLAVVLVGKHPASEIYVNRKAEACITIGMRSLKINLEDTIAESTLLEKIKELNEDETVDGILVQLPLPSHIDPAKVTEAISPEKDVDGFHPLNVGKLLLGEKDIFFPCTPLGIQVLLEKSGVETSGKQILIIGRSNIVGKPMAAMLLQRGPQGDATVTIAHSKTPNIKELSLEADIIILAMGRPKFLTADMIKEGAIVIDVGTNKIEDPSRKSGYRIVGDADFESLKNKCALITPVPGGVGPMTIAMLLSNTLKSFKKRHAI